MVTEAQAQRVVDEAIRKYRTSPIQYLPFVSVVTDLYKQGTPQFGTAVTLVGRAIHHPTSEMISVIGNDERFGVAFLFSRLEMLRKFPSANEGEWIVDTGRMVWNSTTYKIEHVRPTGQLGETFAEVVVLGNTIDGRRET
jgi:hypothetical protein